MKRVLITGANRGIGLALARQFHEAGHQVMPTYRQKDAAESLFSISASESQKWFPARYDAAEPDTTTELKRLVDQQLGGLDLLINNAAMNRITSGYPIETNALGNLSSNVLLDYLTINAVAPLLLSQALLPIMRKSAKPVIVMILSSSGSISSKDSGGNYGYSVSKAALSMVTKVLAADLEPEGFVVVGIHPGWVRTRLGGTGGFLTPDESASYLMERINRLSQKDNGTLLNWDGSAFVI